MMNKPKSKRELIDEGVYCNKEHKDAIKRIHLV